MAAHTNAVYRIAGTDVAPHRSMWLIVYKISYEQSIEIAAIAAIIVAMSLCRYVAMSLCRYVAIGPAGNALAAV